MKSESDRIIASEETSALSPRSFSMRHVSETGGGEAEKGHSDGGPLQVITKLDDETSPVNRAKSLKEHFIEVHMSAQVFTDVDLKIVVVIYLQATDRLYEVVFINRDTAEEISRLYVYEDELTEQMRKRHEALWVIPVNEQSESLSQVPVQKSRRGSLAAKKAAPIVANGTTATNSTTTTPAPRRNSCLPSLAGGQTSSRKASITHPTGALTRSAAALSTSSSLQDTATASATATYRNDLMKDTELTKIIHFNINDSPLMNKVPHVARPMLYFSLLSGSQISPPLSEQYRKVSKSQILRDFRVRADDLSACAVKDISFFTAVIQTSLYVRILARKEDTEAVRFQFVLFDGSSNRLFRTLPALPTPSGADPSESQTPLSEASQVDPAAVIAKMSYKEHLTSDGSDISTVHNLLESAVDLQDQAEVKLEAMRSPDGRNRVYAENINPNSNRYRSMWQAACAAVIARVAEHKRLRAEWDKVVGLYKDQAAQEAALLQERQAGRFRSLAVGKNVSDPIEISMADIPNYREALKAKSKRRGSVGKA